VGVARTGAPAGAGDPGASFEAFLEQHSPQTGEPVFDSGIDDESVEPENEDDALF
jgi:hypothetical protein